MVNSKKRKRTRRRSRKSVSCTNRDKWSVYQTNIRNYDSKRASLEAILVNNKFSVVVINETHLQVGRKIKIPDYVTYTRNRMDKASGGIATSVLKEDSPDCVRVEEGKGDNEFVVTRHSQFHMM